MSSILESGNTIHVSNIAHNASEKTVTDFFSFCGKIQKISVTPSSSDSQAPLSATVTFEKSTAAKTALLLDNSVLEGIPIHVESASSLDDLSHEAEESAHHSDEQLRQEDKPRTTILAEYLAQGYHIGDKTLQRGIELDNKHGVSKRFTTFLSGLDNKTKATDKARAVDSTYGVTNRAGAGYNTVARYFESALNTPTGQKVRDFYAVGSKQVLDIHSEARRLADLKAQEAGLDLSKGSLGNFGAGTSSTSSDIKHAEKVGEGATHCTCGGAEGVCGCPAGECTCAGCAKHGPEKTEKYA